MQLQVFIMKKAGLLILLLVLCSSFVSINALLCLLSGKWKEKLNDIDSQITIGKDGSVKGIIIFG